ncbi:MAG: hypothetical protein Ct9H90mP9_2400 [Pseudomonadota bacterium]|nr:MAG: hypothetical protein Ct9H90mP9_2400 [Pseudomonadota bacterium]
MKFKVVSSDSEGTLPKILLLKQESENGGGNPVFFFMKGSPEAPQCGFSYRVFRFSTVERSIPKFQCTFG